MAEKLTISLISSSLSPLPSHSPITPFLQDLFFTSNSTPSPHLHLTHSPPPEHHTVPLSNRRKSPSTRRLSPLAHQILQTLIHPSFDSTRLPQILHPLLQQPSRDSLASDILGIIKTLGFYSEFELALSIFDWVHSRHDCVSLLNGSFLVAGIVNILGKAGRVSSAASLLNKLESDGVKAWLMSAVVKRLNLIPLS
ncbi:hypothetical protein PIB30_117065 [Stylosanthes scabra]|uniref:Pentatricopeptide repeat-containing protein n=1 Tax=Stylosanthes scabra TaxID=79078 RepID=A0ABU6QCK9_9FABA|nr:hypothetical protein [Stylosanthes scabra]